MKSGNLFGLMDLDKHSSDSLWRLKERAVILIIMGFVLANALWTLFSKSPFPNSPTTIDPSGTALIAEDKVPLTTGEEPISEIFTRAGCSVCHTIPGIPGAQGRVGPVLALGSTGMQRIKDPAYRGKAKTVRDYVFESVLEPELFIVPGYPGKTMPQWYGRKLSALALEKIANYLEQQMESG